MRPYFSEEDCKLVESIIFVFEINAMDQMTWKAILAAILQLKLQMSC